VCLTCRGTVRCCVWDLCVIFTVDCRYTISANVMDVDKCVIPGFHRGVDEIFDLLGCYAAYTANY